MQNEDGKGMTDEAAKRQHILSRLRQAAEEQRAKLTNASPPPQEVSNISASRATPRPEVDFFSPGSESLHQYRLATRELTFARAAKRLQDLRAQFQRQEAAMTEHRERTDSCSYSCVRTVLSVGRTYSADSPPLRMPFSCVASAHSQESKCVLTGSDDGSVTLWDAGSCKPRCMLLGHSALRVTSTALHPQKGDSLIATASRDKTICLWSPQQPESGDSKSLPTVTQPSARLTGHVDAVTRIAYDPLGRSVASASTDQTFRLYDLETQECLLVQDGHTQPLHALSYHPDASLLGVTDYSGMALLWDMRSGKNVWKLPIAESHVGACTAIAFSPWGVQFATGGADQIVKVWDLRSQQQAFVVAAHADLITHLAYDMNGGHVLYSSSLDKTLNLWDAWSGRLLRTLVGHVGAVRSFDFVKLDDVMAVVSVAHESFWKLWVPGTGIEEVTVRTEVVGKDITAAPVPATPEEDEEQHPTEDANATRAPTEAAQLPPRQVAEESDDDDDDGLAALRRRK